MTTRKLGADARDALSDNVPVRAPDRMLREGFCNRGSVHDAGEALLTPIGGQMPSRRVGPGNLTPSLSQNRT
jgi:hypothetical protein